MVTDGGPLRARLADADRAQMVLVGAIVLAVVIVGLTVIMNSLLVTEASAPGETTTQLSEAEAFNYEAQKGVRSLVIRLNHWDRNLTAAELNATIRDNVTTYSRLMAESFATSKAGYVNVSYHNGSSAFGERIVQNGDSGFTSDGGAETWRPVPEGERRDVGWFTANVNMSGTEEEKFAVNVTNESGHWLNVTINSTGRGSGTALIVSSNVSHAGNATARCDPSRDRVLLDLIEGDSFTGACSFNGTNELEPPYDVRFVNGENVAGKYEIALNESVSTSAYGPCESSGVSPEEPCGAPVVWTANATMRFEGSDVSYVNSYNVSVYDEAR